MKSIPGVLVLVVAVGFLAACGKGQSESERSFAEACVKIRGGNAVYKERCECEAGIVASKLSPGELKAYVASPEIQGKPLTDESAAARGFTVAEFLSLGKKLNEAQGEISKACAGK